MSRQLLSGGGSGLGISPNPTSPLTTTTTLTRSGYQNAPVDTTGGAFTLTLPSAPVVGDTVVIVDWGENIATNNLTISGGSAKVQNPHTGSIGATSYAFGSNEGNGATVTYQYAYSANTTPNNYWKVLN